MAFLAPGRKIGKNGENWAKIGEERTNGRKEKIGKKEKPKFKKVLSPYPTGTLLCQAGINESSQPHLIVLYTYQ